MPSYDPDESKHFNYSGYPGEKGEDCGNINIRNSIKVIAVGGGGGTGGTSTDGDTGGGGGGYPAAGIGGGGAGGRWRRTR